MPEVFLFISDIKQVFPARPTFSEYSCGNPSGDCLTEPLCLSTRLGIADLASSLVSSISNGSSRFDCCDIT
jgi:hypothetical protein